MALDDKTRKKILADYIGCQNYRETARMNSVSDATVRRIVKGCGAELSQKVAQKQEENTQSVLEYMEQQTETKKRVLGKLLQAMEKKAQDVDMFTNIKDLATAYGILLDKELKVQESKKDSTSEPIKIILTRGEPNA